jgi:hypothetical protein
MTKNSIAAAIAGSLAAAFTMISLSAGGPLLSRPMPTNVMALPLPAKTIAPPARHDLRWHSKIDYQGNA